MVQTAYDTTTEGLRLLYDEEFPKPLPREEVEELFRLFQAGDINAKQTLVMHNLCLIVTVMMKMNLFKRPDAEDIFQIGVIGLIQSIETFDLGKGFAFSTYGVACIKNIFLNMLKKERVTPDMLSLDEPIHAEDDPHEDFATLKDLLPSTANTEQEAVDNTALDHILGRMKATLTESECELITLRYGLDGNGPRTAVEIAASRNMPVRTLRWQESRALRKLRFALDPHTTGRKKSDRQLKA